MKQIINSVNDDIRKNAYLNWRTDRNDQIKNFHVMAKGYYEAAKTLADSILRDNTNKRADILVYPMLFDLNQCIELYLKMLQWMLNKLLNNTQKFENGHNLIGLYATYLKLMDEFEKTNSSIKGDKKQFSSLMSSVKNYIDEIKALVPEKNRKLMDYSRYPMMSDKDTNHFYIESIDNVTIDVEYFRDRIKTIYDSLESMFNYLDVLIEYNEESWE